MARSETQAGQSPEETCAVGSHVHLVLPVWPMLMEFKLIIEVFVGQFLFGGSDPLLGINQIDPDVMNCGSDFIFCEICALT